MHGWQAKKKTHLCVASSIRAMPETEIPPVLRGDIYLASATKKDAKRFVKQIRAFSGLFGLFQPGIFFLRHLFLILSVKISRPKKMPVFFHSLNDLFAALVVPIITAVPVFVVVRIALVCVIVMAGLVRAAVRIMLIGIRIQLRLSVRISGHSMTALFAHLRFPPFLKSL